MAKHAVSAVLLGLGIGQWFRLRAVGCFCSAVFVPLSVLLSAALRSLLGTTRGCPSYHYPFLVRSSAAWTPAGAAGPAPTSMQEAAVPTARDGPPRQRPVPTAVSELWVIPRADVGLLVCWRLPCIAASPRCLAFWRPWPSGAAVDRRCSQTTGCFTGPIMWRSPRWRSAGVVLCLRRLRFVLALLGVVLCALATLGLVGRRPGWGCPSWSCRLTGRCSSCLALSPACSRSSVPKSVDFRRRHAGAEPLPYFRTRRELLLPASGALGFQVRRLDLYRASMARLPKDAGTISRCGRGRGSAPGHPRAGAACRPPCLSLRRSWRRRRERS